MIDPKIFYNNITQMHFDDQDNKALDYIYEEIMNHARGFLTWYTEDYFTDENFKDIYENWYKGK